MEIIPHHTYIAYIYFSYIIEIRSRFGVGPRLLLQLFFLMCHTELDNERDILIFY